MAYYSSHPGSADRARAQIPLLNGRPVPPGKHHDVQHPIPVTVTLRWETGDEQLDTIAVEGDLDKLSPAGFTRLCRHAGDAPTHAQRVCIRGVSGGSGLTTKAPLCVAAGQGPSLCAIRDSNPEPAD